MFMRSVTGLNLRWELWITPWSLWTEFRFYVRFYAAASWWLGRRRMSAVCSFWKLYSERTHQFLYNELMGFFGALLSGPSAGCYSLNTVTFGIHWGRTKWKDYSTTDTNSHGHSDPVPSVCGQLQWFIWVLLCVCVCANWAFYRNWYMLTVFTSWVSLDLSDDLSSLTSLSSIHPPTCLYGPATTSSLSTTPKAFRGQPV